MTAIEWVKGADGAQGKTWNPIVGCFVVSPGCTNCYAMKMAARLERMGVRGYEGLTRPSKAGAVWTGKMRLVESALAIPLKRRAPTTYFVNSMSDLFHEHVSDEWIDRVFAVMALAPHHTFQILTKRSGRMREYLTQARTVEKADIRNRLAWDTTIEVMNGWAPRWKEEGIDGPHRSRAIHAFTTWPLPNVWLGVSAEDQQRADERVPDLLATPAAIRFVSAEPLLGPIDFRKICMHEGEATFVDHPEVNKARVLIDSLKGVTSFGWRGLDWIIVGGESGRSARPMHPEWERGIREPCASAGVAYFRKQWGAWKACDNDEGDWPVDQPSFIRLRPDGWRGADGWPMQRVGKKVAGHLLDGVEHRATPEVNCG